MRKLLIALLFAAGCAPAGSEGLTGPMDIRLVDAPSDTVKQIVVTVTGVDVHTAGGGWQTVAQKTVTVNLLTLQGGNFASLGVAQLPAGHITQMRLYVTDAGPSYVTTPDGAHHPLTVPSGDESGIKIKLGVDAPECAKGNVTVDFDGKNSIFTHPLGAGAGDEWILRPVVRLKSVQLVGDGCGDAGTPAAVDAGTIGEPPPPDPCANVTCPSSDYCLNGQCIPIIG